MQTGRHELVHLNAQMSVQQAEIVAYVEQSDRAIKRESLLDE